MPADTRRASAGAASPPGGFLAKLRLRKTTDASTSSTNTSTSSSSSSLQQQPPPPPPLKPSIRTSSSSFSSMHDPQQPSRKAFAALLSDPHQFAPFRQKYSSHPECAPLILFCDGYNRLETLLIAICTGTDVHSATLLATPTDQSAIRRFLDEAKSPIVQDHDGDDDDSAAFSDIVSIPEWLSTLLLRFQETFVMSGGQHEIKQLSSAARLSVAYGLKHIGENRVRVSVFDECAAEVHEMLFERWYPEFLASGTNLHRLRESGGGQHYHHPHPPPPPSVSASASVARAAEESSAGPFRGEAIAARNSRSRSSSRNNNHRSDISNNSHSRSRSRSRSNSSEDERDSRLLRPSASSQQQSGRQFKWKSLTLLGRSKSRASSADRIKQGTTTPPPMPPMPYQYTREDFIRLLFDVEGYSDFVAFAKETLCLENIMFYEAFVRLELQIGETLPADAATGGIIPRTDTGLTRCLVRFLENNALQPTRPDPQQYYVPTPLMTNLILFYSTFIMPGAQHEVNISHALRKAIVSALHKRGDEEGAEGIGGKGLPALVRDQGVAISVFDDAADEILDMLYRNTYHLYLRQRADAGGGAGGSGGSGPRGARNKKEGRNSSPVC